MIIAFLKICLFLFVLLCIFFLNLNLFILIRGYFTILYWVCHTSTSISHRYTRVPHPEPTSLLPPIPSLWAVPVHQPQASSIMHGTWTGDSFHILYMFQCHSPKSSHPLPLSQMFYTAVSLLFSHIQGYCYRLSKFHIYALVYCIGVFLSGLLHSV